MKSIIYIFAIIIFTGLVACKKEKKQQPTPPVSGGSSTPFTVSSIPDTTGYVRKYNVVLTKYVSTSSTSTVTATILQTFTCTAATVGDTTVPQGVRGKRYLYTTNDSNQSPFRAYSYYNLSDSTWYLIPLGYSEFIKPVSFKLPLAVGKSWTMPSPYGDNLNVADLINVNINNSYFSSFRVLGGVSAMVNFQLYNYTYFVGSKGIIKYQYNDIYVDPGNSGGSTSYTHDFELIYSNF